MLYEASEQKNVHCHDSYLIAYKKDDTHHAFFTTDNFSPFIDNPKSFKLSMAKHKVHRTPAWKRDTLLLSCILRVRIQPPVPYATIASFLIRVQPDTTQKLAKKAAPRDIRPKLADDEHALKEWLESYLEERYNLAEDWSSDPWQRARDCEYSAASEMLDDLGVGEGEYKVKGEEEMRSDMEWKKKRDWKAKSEDSGPSQVPLVRSSAIRHKKDAKSDGQLGLRNVNPIPQHGNVTSPPETSTRDPKNPWGRILGVEQDKTHRTTRSEGWIGIGSRELPFIPKQEDVFGTSSSELLGPLNQTLGAVGREVSTEKSSQHKERTADHEAKVRIWNEHQQRIRGILERMEAVQQKYRNISQDLNQDDETQQRTRNTIPIEEHRAVPELPRVRTTFDHQFQNIQNIEQLIHKQGSSASVSSPTFATANYGRAEGPNLSDMAGYGGDANWTEMGRPN